MGNKNLFPTLGPDGWLTSSTKIADYLLSHYFLSDYSQTANFPANVFSFAWVIQRYSGNPTQTASEVQKNLSNYFSSQFKDVDVQVTDQDVEGDINASALTLYLVFTDDDGVTYNLSRLLKYSGMRVIDLIAIINGTQGS